MNNSLIKPSNNTNNINDNNKNLISKNKTKIKIEPNNINIMESKIKKKQEKEKRQKSVMEIILLLGELRNRKIISEAVFYKYQKILNARAINKLQDAIEELTKMKNLKSKIEESGKQFKKISIHSKVNKRQTIYELIDNTRTEKLKQKKGKIDKYIFIDVFLTGYEDNEPAQKGEQKIKTYNDLKESEQVKTITKTKYYKPVEDTAPIVQFKKESNEDFKKRKHLILNKRAKQGIYRKYVHIKIPSYIIEDNLFNIELNKSYNGEFSKYTKMDQFTYKELNKKPMEIREPNKIEPLEEYNNTINPIEAQQKFINFINVISLCSCDSNFREKMSVIFYKPVKSVYLRAGEKIDESKYMGQWGGDEDGVIGKEGYLSAVHIEETKLLQSDITIKRFFSKYIDNYFNDKAEKFSELIKPGERDIHNEKNQCMINCILNQYEEYFKNKNTKMDRTKILEIIDKKELIYKSETPLSINDIKPFFEKYKIGYIFLDCDETVICHYKGRGNAALFVCIIKNYHCYLVNNSCKKNSISHILSYQEKQEIEGDIYEENYNISDKFNTKMFEKNDEKIQHYMIKENDDIIPIIKNIVKDNQKIIKSNKEEKKQIYIIHHKDDLTKLAIDMKNLNYEPKISINKSKCICSISFSVNITKNYKINILIKTQQLNTNEIEINDVIINEEEIYNKYYEQNKIISSKILIKENLSYYNPDDEIIESQYKITAVNCYFEEPRHGLKTFEFDKNKCYMSLLMKIKKIPVFGQFDKFEEYKNNEPIEDLNYYVIKMIKKRTSTLILMNNTYTRLYGFLLKNIPTGDYKIIYVKKPSNIIEVFFEKYINDLLQSKITDDKKKDMEYKKFIVNSITGMLEKKRNTKNEAILFTTAQEATEYEKRRGGVIRELIDYKKLNLFREDSDSEDDDEDQEYINIKIDEDEELKLKKYNGYLWCKEHTNELKNGFKYIKELIYDLNKLEVNNNYNKMINNNIEVIALKTDALYVYEKDVNKIQSLFKITEKIGDYKITEKEINLNFISKLDKNDNELITLKNVKRTIYEEDENDNVDMAQYITNNTIIHGERGGCGKSYTTLMYCKNNNKKLLMIMPYNTQCLKFKREMINKGIQGDAITIDKLFGLIVNNEDEYKNYNVNEYDVICFDEIYSNDFNKINKIYEFINKHLDKIIIASGDVNQLEFIGAKPNNIKDVNDYFKNNVIRYIFKNEVYLKKNWRIDNEEDKKTIKLIMKDINDGMDIIDVIKKYNFKTVSKYEDITTRRNIGYYTRTNQKIGEILHKKFKEGKERYYKGLSLICRKDINGIMSDKLEEKIGSKEYKIKNIKESGLIIVDELEMKIKTDKFKVNNEYLIVDIDNENVILRNCINNQDLIILKEYLVNFNFKYTSTAHQNQGDEIDEEYTILDCTCPYISKKWINVCIGRCKRLKDITFFIEDDKINNVNKERCKFNYLTEKIKGYKQQDKKAERIEKQNEDYVDVEFIRQLMRECNNKCDICNVNYYFTINDGIMNSNLTVQRHNNKKPHIKTNCSLLCLNCNRKLK